MERLPLALIQETRHRLVTGFPAQVRAALAALSDEQIWWRPNPASNSVGNLVLHVCGSSRHFLGRGVGGSDYRRNRPAEFAEQGPLPRAELNRIIDETVAETDRVLSDLRPESLLDLTDKAGDPFTVLSLLLRTSHHWAVHTGQIVYAAKALKAGAFEELWMKTML